MGKRKYGVIYTPKTLASFVAELLFEETNKANLKVNALLDPACGEYALLNAAHAYYKDSCSYYGIDVDLDILNNLNDSVNVIVNDAILPKNVKRKVPLYWREKMPEIQAIIANPPWSSEKIYDKSSLKRAGYSLSIGQYDSYVLFIELAYNILQENGFFAFIIPDSIFDSQNETLRKFLVTKTEIKVIARLGEKIFSEVNRATTVLVCKKETPNNESTTKCFRLSTDARNEFLKGENSLKFFFDKDSHKVLQERFANNVGYEFNIDTHSNEEKLLNKISKNSICWSQTFMFGRGVEISKHGEIVECPKCGYAQGYKKSQLELGKKNCTNCNSEIRVNVKTINHVITKERNPESVPIFIGENIRRYKIDGGSYILPNIEGINYKNTSMYEPPKILIRKTGLGLYAAIDYSGGMTTQTVYIFKYKDRENTVPLEYYLALINSRVVYYYYLKIYGENEWKSHPYVTKKIIFSLPIRCFEGSKLDEEIVDLASQLVQEYNYKMDLRLEKLIMKKYGLSDKERKIVWDEMNSLPNLSAINDMKLRDSKDV